MIRNLAFAAAAAVATAACSNDRLPTDSAARLDASLSADPAAGGGAGAVYTLTNASARNAVAIFTRSADGTLTPSGTVGTDGFGTGGGLGSQGALALSSDDRWLFAVNAGSNDVSAFAVTPTGLALASRVSSGGALPISLTVHGNLLYVLNAGGSGNIAGFTVGRGGGLVPLPGSTRPLSGTATGPAQVAFSPNGNWLVVTEKNTNLIDTYAVGADGSARGPTTSPSVGIEPFGFSFGLRGELLVSEAFSGAANQSAASSYTVGADGRLQPVSASVTTQQTAACWLVVTPDGRFAYTTNTGSGSISGFRVNTSGVLSLLDSDGRTGVVGAGPIDMAVTNNGQYIYDLNSRDGTLSAFRIQSDGSLAALAGAAGLPAGAVGLAAR